VGVTVLGLVFGSARDTSTRERSSAASGPSAAAIMARTAAAVSAAAAGSVLQMIVTSPQGVSRVIVDDPGQVTELVRNRAGSTMAESAIRRLSGPGRGYESRAVNYAAGTWSETVLADAPGGPGGAVIETPADAIAAQLHHQFGSGRQPPATHIPATHAWFVRATTLDGGPAYVLVLSGPGAPPATVWISRSTWLPVQSSSPGVSVSYEWTAPGTMSASSLWPAVPAGLARIPAGVK
jgi:hypothetical protein